MVKPCHTPEVVSNQMSVGAQLSETRAKDGSRSNLLLSNRITQIGRVGVWKFKQRDRPMKSVHIILFTGLLTALGTAAFAEGDVTKGKKVFRKCKACHAIGEGAKTKTGPILNGIVGAHAGRDEEFSYSEALTGAAAEGLVWNEEQLAAFLTKPKDFLKGTKMSFSGLRKPADVANLVAYLATHN